MAKFRNPVNGDLQSTNNFLVLLGCLFFGPVFFFSIGEIGHGFITLILSIPLWLFFAGWIIHLIWLPFSINIVSKKWNRKGWVQD